MEGLRCASCRGVSDLRADVRDESGGSGASGSRASSPVTSITSVTSGPVASIASGSGVASGLGSGVPLDDDLGGGGGSFSGRVFGDGEFDVPDSVGIEGEAQEGFSGPRDDLTRRTVHELPGVGGVPVSIGGGVVIVRGGIRIGEGAGSPASA